MNMDKGGVSEQAAALFLLLKQRNPEWLTSNDVAAEIRTGDRTARSILLRFVKAGIVEVTKVFPGYRYRLYADARSREPAYVQSLETAVDVFGLTGASQQ